MSEHEREAVQAWPLAGDPRATLERFAASDVCRRAMGEGLLGSYVAVRAADLDATQEWSFEAIRALWLSRM
jgi:glutamine synthetase